MIDVVRRCAIGTLHGGKGLSMRHCSIFGGLIALSIGSLGAASALAQNADCKQLNDIFATADWRSLATGPFAVTGATKDKVAPAKNVLNGFDDCKVLIWENLQRNTETQKYICRAPSSTAPGQGLTNIVAAVQAVAAPWRSCLAGWAEHTNSKDLKEVGAYALIRYRNKEQDMLFSRNDIENRPEPVMMSLSVSAKPLR